MVNYCCIQGCNRNSRIHKHLNFYSLPKERNRQKQWLKLARRDDLLSKDMDKLRKTLRFCSRHFSPNNVINRHLSQDAMPTKSLPGSTDEDEPDILPEKHEGIICDSCQDPILGFRYKCVTCDNYDLCQKCEMLERHPQHYMLRIAKSIGFQLADDLINKWRNLFKSEHITANCDISSDDEPVTKYIRNYDSGVDLSEDVKNNIKNEVARALKAVKRKVKKAPPKDANVKTPTLKRKEDIIDAIPSKKPKIDNTKEIHIGETETAPEMVFEDVNSSELNLKFGQVDVKNDVETAVTVNVPNQSIIVQTQPLLYVTLSNDLSQLMIELAQDDNASGNQSDVIKMTTEHL